MGKDITIDPVEIEGNPRELSGFRRLSVPLDQYKKDIGDFFKSRQGHDVTGAANTAANAIPGANVVKPFIEHPALRERANYAVQLPASAATTGGIGPVAGTMAGAGTKALVQPAAGAPPPAGPSGPILRGQGDPNAAPAGGAPAAPEAAPEPLSLSGQLPGTAPVQHIAAHNIDTVDPGLRQNLMDATDREKEAATQQGDAAAQADLTKAAGMMNAGTQLEQDAQRQKAKADFDGEQLAMRRERIDAMADQVSKMAKVNPDQYWEDKGALNRISTGLALALGAFSSAFNGTRNHVLDSINKGVDDNIAVQKDAYNRANGQLDDQRNLYSMAMQATGNPVEAQALARNMLIDSIKMKADAQATAAGSQTHIANAARLGTQLDKLKAEDDIKMHNYVQARDVGGGPTGPKPEELVKMAADYQKEAATNGHNITEQQALDHARALWYGGHGMAVHGSGPAVAKDSGATPGGMTKEQAGLVAKDHLEVQRGTDEFNSQMDNLAKSPVLDQIGWDTALLQHGGQRIAPASTKTVQSLKEINTQTLQAVGKVAKDADGKPNKEMIAKIEERFEIHPGDTKEVALQKIQGVRQVYNALARQQGASAPEPNKSNAPSYFTPSK